MKEKFYEYYYKPDKEEFKRLLKEGLLVFDTNVLLDVFRLPNEDAKQLIEFFEKKKEQIWIPYQVGKEFHTNVPVVLCEHVRVCSRIIDSLTEAKQKIQDKKILSSKRKLEDLIPLIDNLKKELEPVRDEKLDLISNNPLFLRMGELFTGRVGSKFDDDDLNKIYVEGEDRYKKKVPPGYKDKAKEGNDKYGDLVLWKEIINKANQDNKSVIYITNDKKEDWYESHSGRTIGPRPELIREFRKETGKKGLDFYCYTRAHFFEMMEKNKMGVSKELLDKLKNLSQEEEEQYNNSSSDEASYSITNEACGEADSTVDTGEVNNSA